MTNLRRYKLMLKDHVEKQKQEHENIVKDYQEHIDSVRLTLEKSSPQYQLLQEKKAELKRSKVRCLMLEASIKERKKINKQKMVIQQKLFYNQIVGFAQAWLDRKKYEETAKKLDEITVLEREWMDKVMHSKEELQNKQKMINSRKDNVRVPFEVFYIC